MEEFNRKEAGYEEIFGIAAGSSLCFGMLPMPGFAEAAEETQKAVLEEDIPDEAVEAAEPEPSEEAAGETLEETFAAEEALPESGPALVITEQPEDTLTVEGVAYFVVSAQVEQDGQVLEEAEVSCQWQHLEGDTWVTLEGETGEILAVEAPEAGAAYRCLVTWGDLEAVSEAAAVVGEEVPLVTASAVWVNPEYKDLFGGKDLPEPEYGLYGSTSSEQCTTEEEVILALRKGLVNRETDPTVTLVTTRTFETQEEGAEFLDGILTHLFDHTGDPVEGDYLRRDIGYCGISYYGRGDYKGNTLVWTYTISLCDIVYFTDLSQEAAMDAEVARVLASLDLAGKTDKQKVDAIYDYLIKNVKYVSDAELNDPTNLIKYSSYAALVQKNAVCQGFAGAFYRLCLEEGIDSRIVSSEAMNHAWNIVKLGSYYYHLDATWDINWKNSPRYYLKGTVSWLKDHKSSTTNYISELGDQFGDASFASGYPVPEEDYGEAEEGYVIAFDGNTTEELLGSMTPIQAPWDADVTLPQCYFIVPGYNFTGWNTQADGRGKTYQPGDTVRNLAEEGTVTLYAQWKPSTYRLVFRPGTEEGTYTGSTNAMEGLVNGETYQMPQNGYSRLGYTFVGWYREGWPDDLWQPGEDFRFTKVEQGAEIAFIAQWKANTYRAVFLPGAEEGAFTGSVAPMEDLENGKQYTLPKNRYTRPGYIFAGWSFDGTTYAEGERFTVHGEEAETLEFAACWDPIIYTVRFNANKGTGKMADQKDIAFDTPTELAKNTFNRKGYHFVGWNTKANGTGEEVAEADNLTTKKSAVVTLYAMWEANEYTVVFHGPDGVKEPQTMTYDRNEVLAPNPFEKAGYTFAKWNTQENGKGKAYTNNAKVKNLSTGENQVDLYAQWTPNKYTVEFHSNLAKDTVKKQTLTYDGKQTALTANSFTWKGHAFQGWVDENGVAYENKEPVQNLTTGKSIALYAQWKVNEYTIVFDSNGAGQADVEQLMTYDVAEELYKNSFERPGYDFSGWATTAKGRVTHVDGKNVKNLTDKNGAVVRLYAVWTPHTYTVEFGKGEGTVTGTMKSQKMTYGKAAALTGVGFKRTSYTFDGWKFGDGILLNKEKVSDLTTVQNGTVTLTALWTPTKYTISYQGLTAAEREELLQTYTVETAEGPGKPTRPGCEFAGWYLDAKFTKPFAGFAGRTGTLKLYPKWTGTAYKYTVKFASGVSDATGNMEKTTISAVSGKEYAPKACSFKWTGYVFDCWCLPNGTVITTREKFSNLGQKENDVVTLTAVWKPITYKVRFNANKGTGKMADQTGLVYDESTALNTNAFTRSGYTFAGWSTKANGTDPIMEAYNLTTKNNGTVTLYAQWIKNP